MTFFCPECWKKISGDIRKCPYCGSDVTEHDRENFEQKLINALRHPERETVQRAIWILGRIKNIDAVNALISLFEKTDNPYIKSEILDALYQIETPEALGFVTRALDSEISIVKRRASKLMQGEIYK